MADSIKRFSTRVQNYARYRPDYPYAIIDLLRSDCGLTVDSIIGDIGSGTGLLSEVFLKNGNRVFGVEPNGAMRAAGKKALMKYPNFSSVDGTAEATNLEPQSMNFVTAGQAFHWFDRAQARIEFARILKPEGFVVLIWNDRRVDSTPFLRAYEDLLVRFGTDYEQVRQLDVEGEIAGFFAPEAFARTSFENFQDFGFESLKGRVFSSSYTPEPDHPNFGSMIARLSEIFAENQGNGAVRFEYDTKIYYGHLAKVDQSQELSSCAET